MGRSSKVYTIDNIEEWVDQVELDLGTALQYLAMSIWRSVTIKSPVDTGRFRASWNVAYGDPNLSVQPEGDYAGAIPPAIGVPKTGDTVYVTNNLDYGPALEDGHSPQAPPGGIVLATVLEINQMLNEAVNGI